MGTCLCCPGILRDALVAQRIASPAAIGDACDAALLFAFRAPLVALAAAEAVDHGMQDTVARYARRQEYPCRRTCTARTRHGDHAARVCAQHRRHVRPARLLRPGQQFGRRGGWGRGASHAPTPQQPQVLAAAVQRLPRLQGLLERDRPSGCIEEHRALILQYQPQFQRQLPPIPQQPARRAMLRVHIAAVHPLPRQRQWPGQREVQFIAPREHLRAQRRVHRVAHRHAPGAHRARHASRRADQHRRRALDDRAAFFCQVALPGRGFAAHCLVPLACLFICSSSWRPQGPGTALLRASSTCGSLDGGGDAPHVRTEHLASAPSS